jgi:hypothetical protein
VIARRREEGISKNGFKSKLTCDSKNGSIIQVAAVDSIYPEPETWLFRSKSASNLFNNDSMKLSRVSATSPFDRLMIPAESKTRVYLTLKNEEETQM